METSMMSSLLVYGPLGVISVTSMWVAHKLYRDREADREKHKAEMLALEQRYIAKAEHWMERYHELSKSLKDVFEAVTKRQDKD